MKRLFFDFIWQYGRSNPILPSTVFSPIVIEFEYDKFDPSLTFEVIVMGMGFEVFFLLPWKAKRIT